MAVITPFTLSVVSGIIIFIIFLMILYSPYTPIKMDEGCTAWGAQKIVLSNSGLGIKPKKYLYEEVILPKALYGAEAWRMRSAVRRKVNVLEMKCLRSLVGVSQMDRVKNLEVRRRAGIERS